MDLLYLPASKIKEMRTSRRALCLSFVVAILVLLISLLFAPRSVFYTLASGEEQLYIEPHSFSYQVSAPWQIENRDGVDICIVDSSVKLNKTYSVSSSVDLDVFKLSGTTNHPIKAAYGWFQVSVVASISWEQRFHWYLVPDDGKSAQKIAGYAFDDAKCDICVRHELVEIGPVYTYKSRRFTIDRATVNYIFVMRMNSLSMSDFGVSTVFNVTAEGIREFVVKPAHCELETSSSVSYDGPLVSQQVILNAPKTRPDAKVGFKSDGILVVFIGLLLLAVGLFVFFGYALWFQIKQWRLKRYAPLPSEEEAPVNASTERRV